VKGFRVEQGDVLLSVQMILTREEESRRRQPAPHAVHRAPQRPVRSPARASRPVEVHRATRPRTGVTPAPVMVDPLTGVGTIHALRRDLMLEQAWPKGSREAPSLIALEIAPLAQIRTDMGAEAGDQVLKCLVEIAPFALRTEDRIYRSGRDQLTVLFPGTDRAGTESALSALETALRRRLDGRGYPEVRLASRKLDPVALAS
jgi:GGDEF domain-containing protein